MIQLSYSTFGLTNLSFLDAIDAVDEAGYAGIELSFHRDQFNPFEITDDDLAAIRRHLKLSRLKPACVATASHFFTPSRPHEPSLMSPDLAGRRRRINLVKRGVHVARQLGISLVTFGSGFLRDEHLGHPATLAYELLVDSIRDCLGALGRDEDITLLIEPEPGMVIETVDQALQLIRDVDSPQFRLHLDICHMYCSESDPRAALAQAAPFTRYLHVSDARPGYNLKMIRWAEAQALDLNFARYLIYFPEVADYLLVDRDHPVYFHGQMVIARQKQRIDSILRQAGILRAPAYVEYDGLFAGSTPFDDEIFTYLISVPGLSFDVLERAKPIIAYLRSGHGAGAQPLVENMVANTLTGIVHFHEIPGEGTLDFASSFKTLSENGFSGYGSVELYHHVGSWEKALRDSYRCLTKFGEVN